MGHLLNPIRAILFDADGVIQHTPPAFHQALIDVAGKAGADPGELLPAIFSAERPAIIGQGSLAEALAPVLERFGLADALQDLLPAWHLIEPDRGALAFVKELRTRRFTCCLATNQQDVRRHYMSHELGYRTIYSAAGPRVLHLLLQSGVLNRLYLTYDNRLLGGFPFAAVVEGQTFPTAVGMTLHSLYHDPQALDGLGQLFAAYNHA